MEAGHVLIVDDEPEMLINCERLLTREGYICTTLNAPKEFPAVIRKSNPDVVLCDLRMPGVDGMHLLTVARSEDPDVPFVMMTAYGTVSSAVQAIQEGAFDYLTKPFTAQQLSVAISRAVRQRRLMLENRELRNEVARDQGVREILGESPLVLQMIERIRKVAASDANVFVWGESGTGKELVARSVHAASRRRDRHFVTADCAAIPASLLESTLFGHEKGAFTGAVAQQRGLLEHANRGTLFFDEITELTRALQSKLLRALQEREVRRVGGSDIIKLDVRVIAATNLNPQNAVAEGRLREDLYYRLNVIPIEVPALRDRGNDCLVLFEHFLDYFAAKYERKVPKVSRAAWEAIESYEWPGNVRELRNVAEQVVLLADGSALMIGDLPASLRGEGNPMAQGQQDPAVFDLPFRLARQQALREFEARYMTGILNRHSGNVTRAAEAAGVSRRTLHRWLRRLRSEEGHLESDRGTETS